MGSRLLGRRGALLAAAALTAGAAPGRVPLAATPISRLETPWWRARHLAKLAEIEGRRVDLVWLGDSITQNWETDGPEPWRRFAPVWRHFYGDRHALNLGFKGDATAHLLWRMQNGELSNLRPRAAVILIGANNFGHVHWDARQTLAGIEAVVAQARQRIPTAGLVLLPVLPAVRGKWVARNTAELDRAMAERWGAGRVEGVTFVEVSGLFMKDGAVDRSQFLDDFLTPPDPPLHPTAQAQARLAEAIEPAVAALLGERPRAAYR